MNTYFTVGELARFCHIPKQTLIFYDKQGIFKPSYIDPKNGYRYYSADQIEILDSILILKEIGLPLKEIKVFMQGRNSENTVTLLKRQHEEIESNIRQLRLVSRRIRKKITTLEDYYACERDKVIYLPEDAEWLAIETVCQPGGLLELDLALKALLNKAGAHHYPYYYQIGDIISSDDLASGAYQHFSHAFLPLETAIKDACLYQKPAGLYASLYHTGPYHTVSRSYETITADIRQHGYRPIDCSYEYNILDSLTSRSGEDYLTQLRIPVEEIPRI